MDILIRLHRISFLLFVHRSRESPQKRNIFHISFKKFFFSVFVSLRIYCCSDFAFLFRSCCVYMFWSDSSWPLIPPPPPSSLPLPAANILDCTENGFKNILKSDNFFLSAFASAYFHSVRNEQRCIVGISFLPFGIVLFAAILLPTVRENILW